MAKTHDAQSALVALARNAEMILDAHLNCGNRIRETDDNRGVLETLEHQRLVWRYRDDDDPDPNLNKELVHLLIHITGAQRRRWASEQIHELWLSLEETFKDYREAKRLSAFTDKERLEATIKEHLNIIIEDIRSATETYVSYLNSGFSYVTDIDLRIRENAKAIDRAGKLKALFDSFNFRDLSNQAGNDPFLKRLLLKHLPYSLEEGRENLKYAINQLRLMLVQMREDQRLSRLIGGFEEHFAGNPGFIPSIADLDLDYCPPVVNVTPCFRVAFLPNIYDPYDDTALIELAKAARVDNTSVTPATEAARATSVEMDLEGVEDEEEDDPVDRLAEQMVLYVVDGDIGDGEIQAMGVLEASDLDIDAASWMHTVEGELNALPKEDAQYIEIVYHSEPDPIYPDNLYIHDITLRHNYVSRSL